MSPSLITVRRAAESRELTLLGTMLPLLGVTDAGEIEQLDRLVRSCSKTVEDVTGRVFARELVTEKFGVDHLDIGPLGGGSRGTFRLMLSRTPILMVEAIRFDGSDFELSDVGLESPEAGFLFSRNAFGGTAIEIQQIERVRTGYLDPLWEVDYSAGYLLPGFPEVNKEFGTSEVDIATDKITATAHGLVVGDTVRFRSTDTLPAGLALNRDHYCRDVTDDDFKVANEKNGAAVDLTDGGSGTHTVERQTTLPEGLEQIVIDLVVSKFRSRLRDSDIKSERLGDHQVSYTDTGSGGIPPAVLSQLDRWRDVVG